MSTHGFTQAELPKQRAHSVLGHTLPAIPDPTWIVQQLFSAIADNDELYAAFGVGPGTQLLDLGSGTGGLAIYLARRMGCRITGIEAHHASVERAQAAAEAAGVADRVRFVMGDIVTTTLPARSFDVVVSRNAFVTVADKVSFFAHCRHVLCPGGQLAASLIVNLGGIPEPPEKPSFLPWPIPTVDDYRAFLRRAGLHVLAVDDMTIPFRQLSTCWRGGLLMWAASVIGELGYDVYLALRTTCERLETWAIEGLIGQVRMIAMR